MNATGQSRVDGRRWQGCDLHEVHLFHLTYDLNKFDKAYTLAQMCLDCTTDDGAVNVNTKRAVIA